MIVEARCQNIDGIILARFTLHGLNVRCDSYESRMRNDEKKTERERHDIVNKYIFLGID